MEGETVVGNPSSIRAVSYTHLDVYKRQVKANIDMLVNTPQVNDWWWIDAIQMGMPVFAKLGKSYRASKSAGYY